MNSDHGKEDSERVGDQAASPSSTERPNVAGAQEVGAAQQTVDASVGAHPGGRNTGWGPDEAKWERRQFWIQATIALVGVFSVVFYYFQLDEMQKATNAATAGLKLTREMAQIDQRAWVSPFEVAKSVAPEVGKVFVIEIPIKNSGKTFARDVAIKGDIGFARMGAEFAFDKTQDLDLDSADSEIKDLLLSPDGEYTYVIGTVNPWSDAQMSRIKYGPWKALVYGTITYYDIFGCVHWTMFCYALDAKDWKWTIYNRHNSADNDRCESAGVNTSE